MKDKIKKWGNYDSWWKSYLSVNTNEPGLRYRNNVILKKIKHIRKVDNVLECGCGAGEVINFLSNNLSSNINFFGCDLSDHIVSRNNKYYEKIKFFKDDLSEGYVGRKKYDVVVCCEVIEHIEKWKLAIKGLVERAVPGGTILVTTQSGKRLGHHLELGHVKHFKISELKREFKKNYCLIREAYYCGWPFMNLKNFLINKKIFNVRESVLRSTKQTWFNKLVFKIFFYLYKLSSKTKGPQVIIVAEKM